MLYYITRMLERMLGVCLETPPLSGATMSRIRQRKGKCS